MAKATAATKGTPLIVGAHVFLLIKEGPEWSSTMTVHATKKGALEAMHRMVTWYQDIARQNPNDVQAALSTFRVEQQKVRP